MKSSPCGFGVTPSGPTSCDIGGSGMPSIVSPFTYCSLGGCPVNHAASGAPNTAAEIVKTIRQTAASAM